MTRTESYTPPMELMRTFQHFRKDPLAELNRLQLVYGDRVFYRTPLRQLVLIFSPTDAQHILRQDTKAIDKRTFDQRIMQAIAGQSVLTLPGTDQWRRQRQLALPAFSHEILPQYQTVIDVYTGQMFSEWESRPHNSDGSFEIADLQSELMQLTLKIISQALFNHHLSNPEAQQLSHALGEVSDYFSQNLRRLGIPWRLRFLPLVSNRHFSKEIDYLFNFADSLLENRHQLREQPHDLLTMFGIESGQSLSPDELRHNILAFLIAGHATTTAGLTWTFVNLSKPQGEEAKERLQRETDTKPIPEYAAWCFEESLRLYPPAWIITRRAMHDFNLDDKTVIPQNAYLLLVPYLIHRHPDFWQDPEVFQPERFGEPRPRSGTIFSFGKGPRACIGQPLAMIEGPQILSKLAKKYDFSIADTEKIKPAWQAILRPNSKVTMTLRPRS